MCARLLPLLSRAEGEPGRALVGPRGTLGPTMQQTPPPFDGPSDTAAAPPPADESTPTTWFDPDEDLRAGSRDLATSTWFDAGANLTTGERDLADRAALRRVGGLSTELVDVTEVEYRQIRLERVVLVGVWTEGSVQNAERSLAELARLAETAGSVVLDALMQRRDKPDAATFIGSGKAKELRDVVVATGADTVICDGELTPGQLRQLEEVTKVKVVDRTWLILDIFAQHARSREGKAQVTLAQMQYMLPRLRGWGDALSRQGGGASGGGIGTRGPGETKLETDRRRINRHMVKLRKEIAAMGTARQTQRRSRRDIPSVVIAGYTNAGKSSILNQITGAGVLVEDALFATLDPTVRKAESPSGRAFTVTDTVGFVRHLPHQLVEAFRSTLEEVAEADLVLHVVDASDDDPEAQLTAVREVLAEVEASHIPELVVINKADAADQLVVQRLLRREPHSVVISARTGAGIEDLLAAIELDLPHPSVQVDILLPYERGDLLARIHRDGEVLHLEHIEDGTRLQARVDPELAAVLTTYAPAPVTP